MSKEVAVQESALPALAPTPAVAGLTGADVALPKLYKGETQSNAFKDDLVPKGCIYVASGGDDPEPQVIWEQGKADGVLVHVLDLVKGKSLQDANDELQTWRFDDPEAPAEARTTYTYIVALPEVDEDIPVKLLMTKTSTGTAKRINFELLKAQGQPLAYRITAVEKKAEKGGQKFQWYIWQEQKVEATPENIAIAERVAQLVTSAPADIERTSGPGNEPAI
jgi:hypothetical protein